MFNRKKIKELEKRISDLWLYIYETKTIYGLDKLSTDKRIDKLETQIEAHKIILGLHLDYIEALERNQKKFPKEL
jgi:hypothetical protein